MGDKGYCDLLSKIWGGHVPRLPLKLGPWYDIIVFTFNQVFC